MRIIHAASAIPVAPPANASTSPSVTNCVASRPVLAPHRTPHHQFPAAALGAHEEQARDVHAGDEQQQAGPGDQRQQCRTDVADDGFRERHHARALATVRLGILLLQARRDPRHLVPGRPGRDAVLQPRNALQVVTEAVLLAVVRLAHRRPDLDRPRRRETEARRQYAHHGSRRAVQGHGRADHAGAAAEPPLPGPVAEDDDRRTGRSTLPRAEVPPEQRGHPEGMKEPGADSLATDRLRAGGRGQQEAGARVHREVAEHGVQPRPVEVVLIRQGGSRDCGDAFRDVRQARRLPVRQRPDQRGVDDAEDGRAGGDTETKDEHGREGEAGAPAKLARREAQVLPAALDHRQRGPIVVRLTGRTDTAQLQHGLAAGLGLVHTRAQVVVDVQLQVALELVDELAIAAVAANGTREPPQPGAKRSHDFPPSGARKRSRMAVVVRHSPVSRSTCFRPARVSR